MIEWLAATLLLIGAIWMLIAALGVLRMPDLLTRMHATTKSGVFGAGLMLLGVAFFYMDASVTARVLAIVGFITLTSPVAAHAIGRAGYHTGSKMWEGTLKDDLGADRARAAAKRRGGR
ncbi:monovalent cation/H(+) antiporter subunit G [Algiphilus aromaticivorans]|uniref:monovalent cation/H(+) antiporter subunit G n=1 Tax=Algiphilus aromaticivorans TaxID=382454 RepID=UPI0006934B25|nr:monovalent cation/H(+) antiporter subunit G [Algiphilus aromaticivorans]